MLKYGKKEQCMDIIGCVKSGTALFPPGATNTRILELYDERIGQITIDKSTLTQALTEHEVAQYTHEQHAWHEKACSLLKAEMLKRTTPNAHQRCKREQDGKTAPTATEGGPAQTSDTNPTLNI